MKKITFVILLLGFVFIACNKDDNPSEPNEIPNIEMITVEGGTFMMGSNDCSWTQPIHSVTLSTFKIAKYEITQKLWLAVMGTNPSKFTGDEDRPVEWVNWNEVQQFIAKLNQLTGKNYRLPTEAEWEYAARGGNKSKGYKYAGSDDIDEVAWYWNNSVFTTHAVGTKAPNELGIYDMSGNVDEWCNDWYSDYSADAVTNPQGQSSGDNRVLRGGSWGNSNGVCLSTLRYGSNPICNSLEVGARLVENP